MKKPYQTPGILNRRDPNAYKAPEPKQRTTDEEREFLLWKAGTRHEAQTGA